ncbi:MAG: RNA polymerase subunit sigma-70, partial [Anaerolineae bacterium]|nr:RNA polymerase subunit sigma-70 [Anaerolineae bacterium]
VNEPIWIEPYPDDRWLADDDHPEHAVFARQEMTLAFIVLLHLLPPRQRAVLILRDVLDFQANEAAVLLDMTVSAVKSALHRARSTMAIQEGGSGSALVRVDGLDEPLRTQLEDYVRAWETADVAALLALLKADATFSMPPIPAWYRGRATIRDLTMRTVFSGQAQGRWHLRPTRANGQPAFGLYRQSAEPGVYHAYGIQVLTFHDGQLADIITFRHPALFPLFHLPAIVSNL